jgi:hypothetical protein
MCRPLLVRTQPVSINNRRTVGEAQVTPRTKPRQLRSAGSAEYSNLNLPTKNGPAVLTHPASSRGPARVIIHVIQYGFSVCAGLSALMCLVAGLKISAGISGATGPDLQTVNYLGKGDRLQLPPIVGHPDAGPELVQDYDVHKPVHNQHLMEGCDSLVSPLAQSPLARIPVRCLS